MYKNDIRLLENESDCLSTGYILHVSTILVLDTGITSRKQEIPKACNQLNIKGL